MVYVHLNYSTSSTSFSRGKSARYSNIFHYFSVTIPRCCKDVNAKSFFTCTARLCNSLAKESFPLTYVVVFYWNSLHARLNRHCKACSYKKREHKKIRAYRKSLYKEPKVNRCLLILDLKPLGSKVKGKHSLGGEFQNLAVRGKKLFCRQPCKI